MSDSLWDLHQVRVEGIRRPRLLDVSVHIPTGSTAIVGYSGAGKTSLLNLLADFEKPHAGTITANLPQVDDRPPVYWVPQNYGLWPHLTAAEHLKVVSRPSQNADQQSAELLDAFHLSEVADKRPHRLSQGERARLSTARALASGAAVLLLDEPLAHVDPARVGRYWETIRSYAAETGASLIVATHSPETVLANTQHAICLKEGQVVYAGPVDELYYRPQTPELASFLGPTNWITSEEAPNWFDRTANGKCCYRPEQIAIDTAEASEIVVESSRFAGAVAEVDLLHQPTGLRRRFYHRPARMALSAGDRVSVKVLLALLVCCVLLGGCGNAQAPQLDVKAVEYWIVPAAGKQLPAPRSMTCGPDGHVYVLDRAGRILVYNESGEMLRFWRMPESDVGQPEGVCVLADGRIAIADTHYHRVVIFHRDGKLDSMQGEYGTEPGQFIYPVGITADDAGNFYVCEYGSNDRVQKFAADGRFLLQFGSFGVEPGQFQRPSGMVWRDGRVIVADAINNRIQAFTDTGEFLGVLGSEHEPPNLYYPYDIAGAENGDLFVVEYGAGRVTRLDATGRVLGCFGTTGHGENEFSTPWGLTTLTDGRVVVADTGNRRIVELRL